MSTDTIDWKDEKPKQMSDKENKNKPLSKEDKKALDSIDQLPLAVVPLKSRTLRNARIFKNAKMETILELHNDPVTGSFQVSLDEEDLAETLGVADLKGDDIIVQNLSQLGSFDVFSMRAKLDYLGLSGEVDEDHLKLSTDMKSNLNNLSREFTMPLISAVFGAEENTGFDPTSADLTTLLKSQDINQTKANLTKLSSKTGLALNELPNFLENYSQVFMSVCYYRYLFSEIEEQVDRFIFWMKGVRTHRETQKIPKTHGACIQTEDQILYIISTIRESFGVFNKSFEAFWDDMSPTGFQRLQNEIEIHYNNLGAVLCGIYVKVRNWAEAFPTDDAGGPKMRAQYVVSDIMPGLHELYRMAEAAHQRS